MAYSEYSYGRKEYDCENSTQNYTYCLLDLVCFVPCFYQKLQQDLEQNFYSGGFSWEEVSPNDAAALVKKFIRELPSPLLTTEHLNTFSAVRDIPELKQKLHVLNLLILLLPEPNRNTLKVC
uniref:Rho-GAP domain-containing protein n=1 Tax=Hucho hucho TaxID=62062 RepID=A0A4W5N2U2_9TELE